LQSDEYQQALKRVREETQNSLNQMIQEHKLDVIIAITRGPAWKIDKVNGDNFNGGISTYAAIAGYPHVTIPLDKVHGLPIGLSIIGLKGKDSQVLQVAEMLEGFIQTAY
jgi:amidase